MILERLIQWWTPHDCLGCGKESSLLCAWCLPEFVVPLPERCYICHTLDPDARVCVKHKSALKHVWVRTQYEAGAKVLLHKLKFERAAAAAEPIAKLMSESLPYFDPSDTVITAVPTAAQRVRLRGYDQAELIARNLAYHQTLPFCKLLVRMGHSRQVGANRQERKKQLTDAFRFIDKDILSKHIILVDDVVTTGATLEAAATLLRKSGAKSVSAVVFAQKM